MVSSPREVQLEHRQAASFGVTRRTGPVSGIGSSGVTAVAVPMMLRSPQSWPSGQVTARCAVSTPSSFGRVTVTLRVAISPSPWLTTAVTAGLANLLSCLRVPVIPASFGVNGTLSQPPA